MQQFSFIDLFESAVHVSGDKLAHLQEHVLQSKRAPENGRVCRPKHVEQIEIDQ